MDVKAALAGQLPGIFAGLVAIFCACVVVTLLQTCKPGAMMADQSADFADLSLEDVATNGTDSCPEPQCPPPVVCPSAPKCPPAEPCSPPAVTEAKHIGTGTGVSEERYTVTPYQLFGPLHWREIPPKMRHDYTLDHKIPVKVVFMDDTKPHKAGAASGSAGVVAYNGAAINAMVQQVKQGLQVCRYSGLCSNAFRDALKVYSVEGKSVVILGSETPWAEAYFIAAGAATVTTVDYRDPSYRHPKLRFLHIDELSKGTESFDVAVSYSSFEHDGLGRYGDPLHPNADLIRMQQAKNIVKPGGLMFLGVPNGKDYLVFNAHRVYGPIRFPMLIKGWKLLRTFGGDLQQVYASNVDAGFQYQLLHVLAPE